MRQFYLFKKGHEHLQARVDALETELQTQSAQFETQHAADVQQVTAAEQHLAEVEKLADELSEALKTQAASLQEVMKSNSTVPALMHGSDTAAAVQDAVNSALELSSKDTSESKESSHGRGMSTVVSCISSVYHVVQNMMQMQDKLWSASVGQVEENEKMDQELKVCPCHAFWLNVVDRG